MADGDERSSGGAKGLPHEVMPIGMPHVVGSLVGWDATRGPLVTFPGHAGGPLAALSIVPLDAGKVAEAVSRQRGVVLAFDCGRADAPIILGLLQPLADNPAAIASVDGERVVVEGKDEIVLRCGAASITLRRNGRVVIRGTFVETRASGVNRIRGGSVQIN